MDASHPYVDNIYISITSVYVIASLFVALGFNDAAFNDAIYRERILSPLRRGLGQHFEALDIELNTFAVVGLPLIVPTMRIHTPPVFAEDPDKKQITVLLIALLQYPVHVYSVWVLRAGNESNLTPGNSEQDWGFGQVVAVILLGSNIVLIIDGIWSMCTVVCDSRSSCELID